MGLGEPEVGEALELVEDLLADVAADSPGGHPREQPLVQGVHAFGGAFGAHRPA